MESIAAFDKAATTCSPQGKSFKTASSRICRNDTTMIYAVSDGLKSRKLTIENTRVPRGSNRLRPTGNLARRAVSRHLTRAFVPQMISVHNKSSAESIIEAMRDNEDDDITAAIFAASNNIFAITLIWHLLAMCRTVGRLLTLMAHFVLLASFCRFFRSSFGKKASISSPIFCSAPARSVSMSLDHSGLTKMPTRNAIRVRIRIERLEHIISQRRHHGIHLQPVVKPFILALLELLDFLILHLLDLADPSATAHVSSPEQPTSSSDTRYLSKSPRSTASISLSRSPSRCRSSSTASATSAYRRKAFGLVGLRGASVCARTSAPRGPASRPSAQVRLPTMALMAGVGEFRSAVSWPLDISWALITRSGPSLQPFNIQLQPGIVLGISLIFAVKQSEEHAVGIMGQQWLAPLLKRVTASYVIVADRGRRTNQQ